MDADAHAPVIGFVSPEDLGLTGEPRAAELADQLVELADGGFPILIDGPQGWKSSSTALAYRACEQATRTPGKTGVPGDVKPRSWTRMAAFSIALFDELACRGWQRFTPEATAQRVAVETFPTHAWRALAFHSLPSKSAKPDLQPWMRHLSRYHGIKWPEQPTHDELQAVVAGLAGFSLAVGASRHLVIGAPPVLEDGFWREGYIVSPVAA